MIRSYFWKMDRQRCETSRSVDRCMDGNIRDYTDTKATLITRDRDQYLNSLGGCSNKTRRDCYKRTGGSTASATLTKTRRDYYRPCLNRAADTDASNPGMAGRLRARATITRPTSNWRKAKETWTLYRRPHLGRFHSELGRPVCLPRWSTPIPSRLFFRGWMFYLFCYLIFLSSGFSSSHALHKSHEPRPKTRGSTSGVSATVEYLQKNFPERFSNKDKIWSEIKMDSSITDRLRLGRAGGRSRVSTTSSIRIIDRESARASCQPRDTVLDSYEELNIPKGYDRKVFPECIVVSRCQNGGCCRDDQECEPRSNGRSNVSKLFLIDTEITWMQIIEDEECECVEKPDFCSPPEIDCPADKIWSYRQCGCICRNRCPRPFLQDENTCACDCLGSNRVCKNIQRGRKDQKLSGEECECVKGGVCRTPNCVNGRFSLSKCKCVQEERNNWS